jgi:hypothetical protein
LHNLKKYLAVVVLLKILSNENWSQHFEEYHHTTEQKYSFLLSHFCLFTSYLHALWASNKWSVLTFSDQSTYTCAVKGKAEVAKVYIFVQSSI